MNPAMVMVLSVKYVLPLCVNRLLVYILISECRACITFFILKDSTVRYTTSVRLGNLHSSVPCIPFMTTRPSWKIWSLSPMCNALTFFVWGIKYGVVFSPVYFSKGLLPSHSLVYSITLLKKERAYKKDKMTVKFNCEIDSAYTTPPRIFCLRV